MKAERLTLLDDELRVLQKATEHLGYSIERVRDLKEKPRWTPEELERFESLASRFARLSDLHIQRVMRLVDELELVSRGSLLDRIDRAEKRGWIAARDLVRIRELRNLIAHEYVEDKLRELYLSILALAPLLIELTPAVVAYGRKLVARHGGLDGSA